MLDIAIKHQEQLTQKMYDVWFNDKYKYWNNESWYQSFKVDLDTWYKHQFVSIDNDGILVGYIGYNIHREDDSVDGLSILSFTDNSLVFGADLLAAIKDIFEKFNFRKLNFTVVVGNPAERHYDSIIKKCGGRIVGVKEKDSRLIDGKYYDLKIYEILKENYLR